MKNDFTFSKVSVPVWALCALINGDYTGLEYEDIALVEGWLASSGYTLVCPPDEEDEIYFNPFPKFGLACDCIDCWCN